MHPPAHRLELEVTDLDKVQSRPQEPFDPSIKREQFLKWGPLVDEIRDELSRPTPTMLMVGSLLERLKERDSSTPKIPL